MAHEAEVPPPSDRACSPASPAHTFATLAEFTGRLDALQRTSNNLGWRKRLNAPRVSQTEPRMIQPKWQPVSQSKARLPVREDGVCTRRDPLAAPLRWLVLEGLDGMEAEPSKHAGTMQWEGRMSPPTVQAEKLYAAQQRLREASDNQLWDYLGKLVEPERATCGAPHVAKFRPPLVPRADSPLPWSSDFVSGVWPKREVMPVSQLKRAVPTSGQGAAGHHAHMLDRFRGAPAARLQATENLHRATRLYWLRTHRQSANSYGPNQF